MEKLALQNQLGVRRGKASKGWAILRTATGAALPGVCVLAYCVNPEEPDSVSMGAGGGIGIPAPRA